MNTTLNTAPRTHFAAVAFAALLTFSMLLGVDSLAVGPAPQALLAQAGSLVVA